MKIYNPSGFSSKLTGSFSGSFIGDGSNITSISSDNIDFNFTAISSSAQIAEDISGSFTSLSSSISSERLKNTTDTLTGDLTVTGTLTAQEFHTEYISGSIIYESGSTKFGDSVDDTHQITGSLQVSGSTHQFFGNVGIGTTSPSAKLTVDAGTENQSAPVTAINILGPNTPSGVNSSQEISWPFEYAGSARIRAYRGASWGTSLQFLVNANAEGSDNPQVKMHLDESGNVGIGTTVAPSRLTVKSSGNGTFPLRVTNTSDNIIGGVYQTSGGAGQLYLHDSSQNENVKISSVDTSHFNGGSVGIGTTSPTDYLDIRPNDGGDTRYIRTHFTGSAAYNNASNNTEEKVASGLRFGWYDEYWQVGAARGGSTDIDGLIFSRNGTEVLVLHESGNVGIGTNNVTTKLTVKGSGTVAKFDSDQSYVDILLQNSSNTGYVNLDSNAMRFYVGGGSSSDIAMVMLNDGSIGIGTTSPGSSLDVVSNAGGNGVSIRTRSDNDWGWLIYNSYDNSERLGEIGINRTAASTGNIYFNTPNGGSALTRMLIKADGNIGIGTTSPEQILDVRGFRIMITNNDNTTAGLYTRVLNGGTMVGNFTLRANNDGSTYLYNGTTSESIKQVWLASGNVGIGVTEPTYKLQVNGTGYINETLYVNGDTTIDANLDLTAGGRIKVSGGNTDQYYFEGSRNGVGVTYRLYDNANNIYHDSWTSQVIRVNQIGGSGGEFIVSGGDTSFNSNNVKINGGTSYNDKSNLYLSNSRTLIQSDIVNLTANGDTSLDFQTRSGGSTASSMFIDELRRVGIGTISPAQKLHVDGALKLTSNPSVTGDGSSVHFWNQSGVGATIAAANFQVRTNGNTNALYINSSQNVGIGNTSPQANLDVNEDLRVNRYHKNIFKYHTTASATNQYVHIKTGVGTNQVCMHMYHVEGYAYVQNAILDERFGFHTDSGGSVYGKSYKGTYANNIYKSSDSKVVLVFGPINIYYMSFMVHLIESGMYTELFVKPTAATYSSSNSGAY